MIPRMTSRRRAVAALVAAPLLAALAACGSGSTASSTSSSAAAASTGAAPSASVSPSPSNLAPAAFPVTVKAANGDVTLAAAPSRIVSMSPTATEVLFAIGAGAQVAAVDSNSNYPENAPKTALSAFEPNAEAVAAYKPDLVVLSNDSNGFLASLGKLKIPALLLPAAQNLDEAYTQMAVLGQATGHGDDAAKVVQETKDRIATAVAAIPPAAKGEKVYHELDQTFYSVTSETFLGSVYTLFGLKNIADAAKDAATSGGYPQLSAEYVVTQAPDIIVLADTKCCQQTEATLAKRPGFSAIPAVKNGKVLLADDDIASRWGPRVADFAETLAKELQD